MVSLYITPPKWSVWWYQQQQGANYLSFFLFFTLHWFCRPCLCYPSGIIFVVVVLFFFLCFFVCLFVCLFLFLRLTAVQVERKQWLECRWTKQFVLSIDDWSMGGQTSLFYLFTNYLRTCCGLVTIGQLWNRKSHPVDQLVCVCVAVTTLRNRESDLGAQSSSYQKA